MLALDILGYDADPACDALVVLEHHPRHGAADPHLREWSLQGARAVIVSSFARVLPSLKFADTLAAPERRPMTWNRHSQCHHSRAAGIRRSRPDREPAPWSPVL